MDSKKYGKKILIALSILISYFIGLIGSGSLYAPLVVGVLVFITLQGLDYLLENENKTQNKSV